MCIYIYIYIYISILTSSGSCQIGSGQTPEFRNDVSCSIILSGVVLSNHLPPGFLSLSKGGICTLQLRASGL